MEVGSNRLVLVREVKDAQAVGGKHVGAVWVVNEAEPSQITSRSCDEDTSRVQPMLGFELF